MFSLFAFVSVVLSGSLLDATHAIKDWSSRTTYNLGIDDEVDSVVREAMIDFMWDPQNVDQELDAVYGMQVSRAIWYIIFKSQVFWRHN